MTAPPDDNAVKRKIRTVLNDVTSETPETSAFYITPPPLYHTKQGITIKMTCRFDYIPKIFRNIF